MSQKPLQIPFLISSKIDSKTYFTPFFVSFISRLNPKRVRYPLQMLELFSTVFSLDKRFESYCISCFGQLKTPKTIGTNNHVEIVVPFAQILSTSDASYSPTRQTSSQHIPGLSNIRRGWNFRRR